ncbi:MAG TPA: hypothetical protein DHU63_09145 [Candidatus Marinimicrobia bacterium]|nr:hypothetical protein [Candidatus Neomarinimicrobiota bacterium]
MEHLKVTRHDSDILLKSLRGAMAGERIFPGYMPLSSNNCSGENRYCFQIYAEIIVRNQAVLSS